MLMTMKACPGRARHLPPDRRFARPRRPRPRPTRSARPAANRAALLTPIAKAFSTDIGDEAASLGVQVHGGMGFIEETGAAQHMRDSRIAAIYEGANGIHGDRPRAAQAAAGRRRDGRAAKSLASATSPGGVASAAARASARPPRGWPRRRTRSSRRRALDAEWLADDPESALAGASPYLRLFGLTLGGACLAKAGLAAEALAAKGDSSELGRVALARFFAEKLAVGRAGPGAQRRLGRRAAANLRSRSWRRAHDRIERRGRPRGRGPVGRLRPAGEEERASPARCTKR